MRKRNRGDITTASFTAAKSSLHLEVADSLNFRLLEVETADTLAGIVLTEKYSIGPSCLVRCARHKRWRRGQARGTAGRGSRDSGARRRRGTLWAGRAQSAGRCRARCRIRRTIRTALRRACCDSGPASRPSARSPLSAAWKAADNAASLVLNVTLIVSSLIGIRSPH